MVEARLLPDRGRGVVALAPVRKGAEAFSELPYAAVQTLSSRDRAPACCHCMAPLGLAAAVAAAVSADARRARAAALAAALAAADGLPSLGAAHAEPPPAMLPCPHGCGEAFCGEACRDAACGGWHGLLCDGRVASESHPLSEFRRHAGATCETFLLAARCVATALAAAVAAGGTPEAAHAAAEPLRVRAREPAGSSQLR
jgi:hypothetical protein